MVQIMLSLEAGGRGGRPHAEARCFDRLSNRAGGGERQTLETDERQSIAALSDNAASTAIRRCRPISTACFGDSGAVSPLHTPSGSTAAVASQPPPATTEPPLQPLTTTGSTASRRSRSTGAAVSGDNGAGTCIHSTTPGSTACGAAAYLKCFPQPVTLSITAHSQDIFARRGYHGNRQESACSEDRRHR
jgi:hypothetical protein